MSYTCQVTLRGLGSCVVYRSQVLRVRSMLYIMKSALLKWQILWWRESRIYSPNHINPRSTPPGGAPLAGVTGPLRCVVGVGVGACGARRQRRDQGAARQCPARMSETRQSAGQKKAAPVTARPSGLAGVRARALAFARRCAPLAMRLDAVSGLCGALRALHHLELTHQLRQA